MTDIAQIKTAVSIAWLAFKQRRLASYIKQQVWAKLDDTYADVWILGQPNSGKSSLLHLLLDEIKPSQKLPVSSFRIETGILLLGQSYAKIAKVAPGQDYIFERIKEDFKKSLSTKNASTIVYVVDYGYNFADPQIQSNASIQSQGTTLAQHRSSRMQSEIDHLEYFIKKIKEVPPSLLKIKDFIVLINKIDLFAAGELNTALTYYDISSNNNFTIHLKNLKNYLSSHKLGFTTLTTCSWPVHQKFNGVTIPTKFDQAQHHSESSRFIRSLDNILRNS